MFGWKTIACCSCHVPFAIEENYYQQLKADSDKWFYCPNGHKQHFTQSEVDRLRRERDQLKQRLAQKDDCISYERTQRERTENRLRATRGVVTKYRRRVGNGVCPCCSRTFHDLARHMASKHPAFQAEAAE